MYMYAQLTPGIVLPLAGLAGVRRVRGATARFVEAQEIMQGKTRDEESQLIRQAQAGDRHAFEQLLERHARVLFSFLVRWLRDRSAADDVFQEATLRAYRSLGNVDPGRPFRPWLFRIAINRAKSYGLAQGRQSEMLSAAPRGASVASAAGRLETQDLVARALAQLAAPDRQILLLRFAHELSFQDIAVACGITQLTARMRLSRARSRFRKAVTALSGERGDP